MFDSSKGTHHQLQYRPTSATNKSPSHAKAVHKSPYKSPSSSTSHSKALQKSAHKSPSRIYRSESQPDFQVPEWVHCEKCFVSYDINASMSLQTCGHIFCNSCLGGGGQLPEEHVYCCICKAPKGHRPLNHSMNPELRQMFCKSWTDPLLQINVKALVFMMTKSQNYIKYLGHEANKTKIIPIKLKEKHASIKAMEERNKKLVKYCNDVTQNIEAINKAIIGKSDQYKATRNYERQLDKTEEESDDLHYSVVSGKPALQADLKFISSGRNEQSNHYIEQVKVKHTESIRNVGSTSHSSIRSTHQRPVPNLTMNVVPEQRALPMQVTGRMPARSPHSMKATHSPSPQTPTFRPAVRPMAKNQPVPPTPGRKRSAPSTYQQKQLSSSYQRDEYTIPSKRANNPILRDSILSPPNSSLSLSLINSANTNRHVKSTPTKPSSYVQFKPSLLSQADSFGPRNQQYR